MDEIESELLHLTNQVRSHKRLAPVESVTESTRLREDLAFNSLDLAEFTVRIEERVGVDVFADGIVTTMGEVAARIRVAKTKDKRPETRDTSGAVQRSDGRR